MSAISTIQKPFKSELQSIKDDSSRVLNIFTQTVGELTAINKRVDNEATKKLTEKSKLEVEIAALAETRERNAKIIGKIENLLS